MKNHNIHRLPAASSRRPTPGFSLIELMVALALGLVLTIAMAAVYVSGKSTYGRQDQLSNIQQNVRLAFEYLTNDARMVGHLGCFTGQATTAPLFTNQLSAASIKTNYAAGVEGYEYIKDVASGAYQLTADAPANSTTATEWATNTDGVVTIPVTDIAGSAAGDGLTPGSDVLVIRTVVDKPVRLTANTTSAATTVSIENLAGGTCSNTTTAKISGFCPSSHGLIASCTNARVFSVTNAGVATTLAMTGGQSLGSDPLYTTVGAEVFPMQTIVYYIKRSISGTTTSLYRRTFDGDNANGVEQELVEGVESLQVRYGVDTSVPPDGAIDAYVTAQNVTTWSTVVAVRMGLLMRSTAPVGGDVAVAASAPVNGLAITYPTVGSKYDRRVFTTTVAVRNKIAYF